jgi:uncharacterized lipoprotein YbaY
VIENAAPENNEYPPPFVSGQIIVSKRIPAFSGAAAHVTLEDVSHADGASVPVAETIITGLSHNRAAGEQKPADTIIEFAIEPPPDAASINPKNDYAVRVWIDRDGDGKQGEGDLYSDQTYRVLTQGAGSTARITLG